MAIAVKEQLETTVAGDATTGEQGHIGLSVMVKTEKIVGIGVEWSSLSGLDTSRRHMKKSVEIIQLMLFVKFAENQSHQVSAYL